MFNTAWKTFSSRELFSGRVGCLNSGLSGENLPVNAKLFFCLFVLIHQYLWVACLISSLQAVVLAAAISMCLKIKQNGRSWNGNKSVSEGVFEVSKYVVQYEGN